MFGTNGLDGDLGTVGHARRPMHDAERTSAELFMHAQSAEKSEVCRTQSLDVRALCGSCMCMIALLPNIAMTIAELRSITVIQLSIVVFAHLS